MSSSIRNDTELPCSAALADLLKSQPLPENREAFDGFLKRLDRQGLRTEWGLLPPATRDLDVFQLKQVLVLARIKLDLLRRQLKPQPTNESKKRKPLGKKAAKRLAKIRRVLEMEASEDRKRRHRKPQGDTSPLVNWLESMPVTNEGSPVGYAQATGQRAKRIRTFLRSIRAKKEPKDRRTRGRGHPLDFYGFRTNLRVLEQWLAKWCSQTDAKRHALYRTLLCLPEIPTDERHGQRLLAVLQVLRKPTDDCLHGLPADSGRGTFPVGLKRALGSLKDWADFWTECRREFPSRAVESELMAIGGKSAELLYGARS
jgi:hypothetical protein